jgi:hypothetical protein
MKLLLMFKVFILLTVITFLLACSSTPEPPPPLGLNISVNIQANNGELFYVVAKTTNEKGFMLDSYENMANLAFSDNPEPERLSVFSVVPGTNQDCTIVQPAEGMIGLYFLLTKPGSQWKKLLTIPFESNYDVLLDATGKIVIRKSKHWYSLF